LKVAYGDRVITLKVDGKREVQKKDDRATWYLPSLEKWNTAKWEEIFDMVNEYLNETPQFKRSKSVASSRATSEVEMISEPEIIVVSDED
jgi:hypothetical protein